MPEQTSDIERHKLKHAAEYYLRVAEHRYFEYACSLPVGEDRERAFEITKNINRANKKDT